MTLSRPYVSKNFGAQTRIPLSFRCEILSPVSPLSTQSHLVSLSESPGNTGMYTLQIELPTVSHKQIQCSFTVGLLKDGLQPKYLVFEATFCILKFLSSYFYKQWLKVSMQLLLLWQLLWNYICIFPSMVLVWSTTASPEHQQSEYWPLYSEIFDRDYVLFMLSPSRD